MKNFRVQIRAYGYYEYSVLWILCDFTMVCEDDSKAFENALLDKLGKNDIVWEKDGI